MCYGRITFYGSDNSIPKCGVPACKLIGKCRRDVLEFLSVEVVPRAEEAWAEDPVLCNHSGERLCDRRLSGSCQTIKPKYVSVLRIFGPSHNSIEDGFSSPPEARIMMTSLVFCNMHRIQFS